MCVCVLIFHPLADQGGLVKIKLELTWLWINLVEIVRIRTRLITNCCRQLNAHLSASALSSPLSRKPAWKNRLRGGPITPLIRTYWYVSGGTEGVRLQWMHSFDPVHVGGGRLTLQLLLLLLLHKLLRILLILLTAVCTNYCCAAAAAAAAAAVTLLNFTR